MRMSKENMRNGLVFIGQKLHCSTVLTVPLQKGTSQYNSMEWASPVARFCTVPFLGKEFFGPKGGSCGGNSGRGGSMARRGGGLLAKRSIDLNKGRGVGGLVVLGGRSSRESKNRRGYVGGVEKMSLTGSKFKDRGEECLDG
ncbi:hypothetical protein Tco_0876741 [Tanacetum coccineum]|uniref:Uncharacterized protein n=1 Tax=Tanacetum coccineum TaxID=301880 RepID=A0ABQ5BT64_9ASTR